MDELCNRLRAERARLNLSQEEFATLGGVKRNTQSLYEKGERIPDAKYLGGIAEAGADVFYILTGKRSMEREILKPEEAALLDNYRHSSEDGKKAIETTSALLSQQGTATKKGKVA